MTKLLLTILIIMISGLFGVYFSNSFLEKTAVPIFSRSIPIPQPSPTPTPIALNPINFQIPKLEISTTVEHVGQTSDGAMDVPKNWGNVAWYNLGSRPGEIGNAVIAGHFDTYSGSPAIFYNLSKLQPGDILVVSDQNGKSLSFTVTHLASYPYNQVPLNDVFGKSDKPQLNLITCDGNYNPSEKTYQERLVVYSQLSDSKLMQAALRF